MADHFNERCRRSWTISLSRVVIHRYRGLSSLRDMNDAALRDIEGDTSLFVH